MSPAINSVGVQNQELNNVKSKEPKKTNNFVNAGIVSGSLLAGGVGGYVANNYAPVADSYIKDYVSGHIMNHKKTYADAIKKSSKAYRAAGWSQEHIAEYAKNSVATMKKQIQEYTPGLIDAAKSWARFDRTRIAIGIGLAVGALMAVVGVKAASGKNEEENKVT
ncbi:MAG: hypothetical protein WCK67_09035 [bacterium]